MLENINNSNTVYFLFLLLIFYIVYTAYIVLKKYSVECRFIQAF